MSSDLERQVQRALTIPCPDCAAPTGSQCSIAAHLHPGDATAIHQTRIDRARMTHAEQGTCDLCGQLMYRVSDPDDAWHPDGLPVQCPPLPDPQMAWNAYARAVQAGVTPGRPGLEHFTPTPPAPTPARIDVTPDTSGGNPMRPPG